MTGCSDDSKTIVNSPRFSALSDSSFVVPADGVLEIGDVAGTVTVTPGAPNADVNVEVSLTAGAGSVRVDFPVVGQVSDWAVNGIIGTGADGKIVAQVGAGSLVVESQ